MVLYSGWNWPSQLQPSKTQKFLKMDFNRISCFVLCAQHCSLLLNFILSSFFFFCHFHLLFNDCTVHFNQGFFAWRNHTLQFFFWFVASPYVVLYDRAKNDISCCRCCCSFCLTQNKWQLWIIGDHRYCYRRYSVQTTLQRLHAHNKNGILQYAILNAMSKEYLRILWSSSICALCERDLDM